MSDIMADFPHLKDATLGDLHVRYNQLKEMPRTDEVLQELVAIARVLRGRASAPAAKKSARAAAPSLDAL